MGATSCEEDAMRRNWNTQCKAIIALMCERETNSQPETLPTHWCEGRHSLQSYQPQTDVRAGQLDFDGSINTNHNYDNPYKEKKYLFWLPALSPSNLTFMWWATVLLKKDHKGSNLLKLKSQGIESWELFMLNSMCTQQAMILISCIGPPPTTQSCDGRQFCWRKITRNQLCWSKYRKESKIGNYLCWIPCAPLQAMIVWTTSVTKL